MAEFQKLGCKVVLLANGNRESGLVWRKANPYRFPAYCDPEWTVYRQLGLRRIAAFNLAIFYQYAERRMKGIPFPRLYKGGDPFIMGGDFVVKNDGKIIYAYHQQTIERPNVEDILSCFTVQPAIQ